MSERCYRYEPKLKSENEWIGGLLISLTRAHRTWGFGLCCLHLGNVMGYLRNPKRVYRIHRELELNLMIKPRKLLKWEKPEELAVPAEPYVTWSLDFVADRPKEACGFRLSNGLDDFNRLRPGIGVDFSLPAEWVTHPLKRVIEWRGQPQAIRVANGPDLISATLLSRAERRGIAIQHIEPGKPQQNACLNRYNRTVWHK